MNINVFANYYHEKNDSRRNELDYCIQKNIANSNINYILIESQERLTYNDYFNYVNNYTSDEDVNVIINLDIYFDESIVNAFKIKNDEFWCCGRWEWKDDGALVAPTRPDSQDAWFKRGKINMNANFELGKLGCDNRLAYEASRTYSVLNPALTIKAIHVHTSNIRNYTRKNKNDLVPGPYHTITPTALK